MSAAESEAWRSGRSGSAWVASSSVARNLATGCGGMSRTNTGLSAWSGAWRGLLARQHREGRRRRPPRARGTAEADEQRASTNLTIPVEVVDSLLCATTRRTRGAASPPRTLVVRPRPSSTTRAAGELRAGRGEARQRAGMKGKSDVRDGLRDRSRWCPEAPDAQSRIRWHGATGGAAHAVAPAPLASEWWRKCRIVMGRENLFPDLCGERIVPMRMRLAGWWRRGCAAGLRRAGHVSGCAWHVVGRLLRGGGRGCRSFKRIG